MSRPPQFLNQHSSVSHSWHHNRVFIPSLSSSPLSSPCHFLIPSHCWSLSSIFWILQQSNKLEDIWEFCHSLQILRNIYKYQEKKQNLFSFMKDVYMQTFRDFRLHGKTDHSLLSDYEAAYYCYLLQQVRATQTQVQEKWKLYKWSTHSQHGTSFLNTWYTWWGRYQLS